MIHGTTYIKLILCCMLGAAINAPIRPKTASPAPPLDPAVLQLKVPKFSVGIYVLTSLPAIVLEHSAEED